LHECVVHATAACRVEEPDATRVTWLFLRLTPPVP
jgi:hypothetical protein